LARFYPITDEDRSCSADTPSEIFECRTTLTSRGVVYLHPGQFARGPILNVRPVCLHRFDDISFGVPAQIRYCPCAAWAWNEATAVIALPSDWSAFWLSTRLHALVAMSTSARLHGLRGPADRRFASWQGPIMPRVDLGQRTSHCTSYYAGHCRKLSPAGPATWSATGAAVFSVSVHPRYPADAR